LLASIGISGSYGGLNRGDAARAGAPMELGDVRLSHSVMARMDCAEHAHVLTGSYRPAELVGLMEHLDMVIAMRLHVLSFAVANFIDPLGMPAPMPVTRDSVGSVLAAVDRAWDMREEETQRLCAAVRELQQRAQRDLDVALSCLCRH
jgi:hypothetical protein